MRRTNDFRYDDDHWQRLAVIIARADAWAGAGGAAREKFTARREWLEEHAGRWKARIATWDGHSCAAAQTAKYRRIEQAARELAAAMADAPFPPIFSGDDLVWRFPDDVPPDLRPSAENEHMLAIWPH